MFRKLRNKFLFLNMVVTSLVMLTAFSVVYFTTYSNTNAEIERKMDNVSGSFVINEASHSIKPGHEPSIEPPGMETADGPSIYTSQRVTSDYALSFVITVDKNGNVIEINSLIDIPKNEYIEAASVAWNQKNNSIIVLADRSWRYRISPLQVTTIRNGNQIQSNSSDYFQILFLDITDMKKTMNDLSITFLFVGIGMLAVIFFVSLLYANRSIQPIAESWEKQKQFIADASHELKTPLTTIITNCDVLDANEEETIKSQREWLDYIRIGTDRMSRLVNSLLTLARVEGMNVQAEKQPFDIDATINGIIQSMDAITTSKSLCVNRTIEPIGEIIGYEDSIRQVFTILYENAVKYANEGGSIDVSVRRNKKDVLCAVRNTGSGIPAKDLPRIFDRFYRSDSARSNDENSYGLGLSIAKGIVEQLGGKITAESAENKWAEFTFTFEV